MTDARYTDDDDALVDLNAVRLQRRAMLYGGLSANDSPDDAARAMELAEATGVPADVIHPDLDNFEENLKSSMAQKIIAENEYIQEYISQNPMHAKVSNNDWGNLDQLTKAIQKYQGEPHRPLDPEADEPLSVPQIQKMLAGGDPNLSFDEHMQQVMKEHPFGVASVLDYLGQGLLDFATKPREMWLGHVPMVDPETGMPTPELTQSGFGTALLLMGASTEFKLSPKGQILSAGGEIPAFGNDPVVDKLHIEQAKADADKFKEVEKAHDGSATGQISPKALKAYVATHPDSTVSITMDGIKKIYGDEEPILGDGKLGIDKVISGYEAAAATNSPIHLTMAEYLELSPELRKELEDDLIHSDGGISKNEGKELEPAEKAEEPKEGEAPLSPEATTLEAVKDSAGVRPLPLEEPEAVKSHAVEVGGKIYEGKTHLDAYNEALKEHGGVDPGGSKRNLFTTTKGRVIKQAEAIELSRAALGLDIPPAEPKAEEPKPTSTADLVKTAFTKKDYSRRFSKVEAEQAAEADFLKGLNEALIRRRQTKEWKEKASAIRKSVLEDIEARPDVAVDRFLRDGILNGNKADVPTKIIPDSLSAEQKTGIDPSFFARQRRYDTEPRGVSADAVARHFGYPSTEALVRGLKEAEETRRQHGIGVDEWRRRIVDSEVETRLEKEFGSLEANILKEARDFVASPTTIDRVYAEIENIAHDAGITPSKYSDFKNTITAIFNNTKVGQHTANETATGIVRKNPISAVRRYLDSAGRAGKAAEEALLDDKFTEAYEHKLSNASGLHMAKEAKELDKTLKSYGRLVERLSQRTPNGIPKDWNLFFHDILQKLGHETEIKPGDLAVEIEKSGYDDLKSFVYSKDTNDYAILNVPESMLDPNFKASSINDLTADAFYKVHDAIQSMLEAAKAENVVTIGREKVELATVNADLQADVARLPVGPAQATDKGMFAKGGEFGRAALAHLLSAESIAKRFSLGDHTKMWFKAIAFPAARANGKYMRMASEVTAMGKRFVKINGSEPIENSLIYGTNRKPMNLTRKNFVSLLTQIGTDTGYSKVVRGEAEFAGMDSDLYQGLLDDMIYNHPHREDFDLAKQYIDIFKYAGEKNAEMVREEGGIPVERLKPRTIDTKFGPIELGYAPMRYDPKRLKPGRVEDKGMLEENEYGIGTSRRHEKDRTGYYGPIDLELNSITSHIASQLRDAAFRPFLRDAKKMIFNNDLGNLINSRLGPEFTTSLKEWVRDIGKRGEIDYKNEHTIIQALDAIVNNTIGNFVMLNPRTVIKHGATVMMHSMFEEGLIPARYFRKMASDTWGDPRLAHVDAEFARLNSRELPYRNQGWAETIGGAKEIALGENKYKRFQQGVAQKVSWTLAKLDYKSAEWMWRAGYEKEWLRLEKEGMTFDDPELHEKAVDYGDYLVRQTHGTTAITSRPAVLRQTGLPRIYTKLYNFFSNYLQRQYEIAWRAKEAKQAFGRGDAPKGWEHTAEFTHRTLVWLGMTALASQLPRLLEGDESLGQMFLEGLGETVPAGVPVLRDIAHYALGSHDLSIGAAGEPVKMIVGAGKKLTKASTFEERNAGELVQALGDALAPVTGLPTHAAGKAAKFGIGYAQGREYFDDYIPNPFGNSLRRSMAGGLYYGTTKVPKKRTQK